MNECHPQTYLREPLEEIRDYFIRNATTYMEAAKRLVRMRSYFLFGYSVEKTMHFHLEKSLQPTYYLR